MSLSLRKTAIIAIIASSVLTSPVAATVKEVTIDPFAVDEMFDKALADIDDALNRPSAGPSSEVPLSP